MCRGRTNKYTGWLKKATITNHQSIVLKVKTRN